ncbi:hypothetical protein E2C01_059784 [Portunus trituberculatus]|uniref:Uncharacterized protein n=1 Tax=Portunus trituberculatus TaxID=210409 RepID=A0A5B7H6S7_PORTR|nr:hypothetical protein [Portunus trituberculatus]
MRSICIVCSISQSTVTAQEGSKAAVCSALRSHHVHVLNITTCIWCGHKAVTHHQPEVITDIPEFKQGLALYPLMRPLIPVSSKPSKSKL